MEKENEAFIKTEDKKSEKSEKGKGQEEEDVSSENEEEKLQAQTPTRMRHNFIIRPFETLTRMYGIPSYAEIDPTPILFITFPLLFGIMFGDIGHGLILIIAGLVGGIIFRKRKTGDIKNMSWIIFYCGWAAMIFGFLYGEFFGQQQILGYQLNPIPIPIPFFGALILYHPLENVMVLFIIAVILGVLHLNLGWILQFINYFMQNKRYLALTETIPKMFFLDSGFYVIFRYSVDFNAWFAAPYPVLLPIIAGLLLIVFKIVGKALGISYIQQQTYGQLLAEGSIETFETVLSIPGNVFSYIRLLALALAHISLMLAIRAMAGLIVGNNFVTQFIIIVSLIFGNLIVILLEGLIVFLNTLRLHFYEFFFKFYKGAGIEYKPFVIQNNFSDIKFKSEAEKDFISEEIEKEIDTEKVKEIVNNAKEYISEKYLR